jgi:hypothetical protein
MQCDKCKFKLPARARFCPKCGSPVTQKIEVAVKQKVGAVKGRLIGAALDSDVLATSLKSSTTQEVESVEDDGTVIGTVIGSQVQVGGNRYQSHGDIVQGDKIMTGDISDSIGLAIGRDLEVNLTQGASAEEIAKMFASLLNAIQSMPESPQKTGAASAVKELAVEAGKGEQAEESIVRKWFSFLAQTAPDILDVAMETFANPIKGVSMVFKKVADRARLEKENK